MLQGLWPFGANNFFDESGNQAVFPFIGWSNSEASNACQNLKNLFLQQ